MPRFSALILQSTNVAAHLPDSLTYDRFQIQYLGMRILYSIQYHCLVGHVFPLAPTLKEDAGTGWQYASRAS